LFPRGHAKLPTSLVPLAPITPFKQVTPSYAVCDVILTIIQLINSISTPQLDITNPVDCGLFDRLSEFNGGHPVLPIEQTKQNVFSRMEQTHYSENSILHFLNLHFP